MIMAPCPNCMERKPECSKTCACLRVYKYDQQLIAERKAAERNKNDHVSDTRRAVDSSV